MSETQLIVMCGLPASGKSTCAKTICGKGRQYVVVCADEFRKVYTGKDFDAFAEHMITLMVKTTVEVMLRRNENVILDMTCLTIKSRKKWIEIARKCNVPIYCVWLNLSLHHCLDANRNRKRYVPEHIISNMYDCFQEPTIQEGFSDITEITKW